MTPPSAAYRARTKIVATVGPACGSVEKLVELINAGASVFRINTAHGTQEEREKKLADIRTASDESGQPVGVLVDLAGPKIRLGELFRRSDEVRGRRRVSVRAGHEVERGRRADLDLSAADRRVGDRRHRDAGRRHGQHGRRWQRARPGPLPGDRRRHHPQPAGNQPARGQAQRRLADRSRHGQCHLGGQERSRFRQPELRPQGRSMCCCSRSCCKSHGSRRDDDRQDRKARGRRSSSPKSSRRPKA